MADRELNVALRFQALTDQARQSVKQLDTDVSRLNRTGAQRGIQQAAQAQDQLTRSAATAAAATRDQATATAKGGVVLNQYGKSAKETAMAMRQLPAQITDITTSIASGMPIWLTAIQQGGQLRDSFGGVRPAASALASVFTPLRLGLGAVTAAGIGLLAIFRNAEQETRAFNTAIQTTGNYAGATRGRIEALADEAERVSGISGGVARDIATGLVQGGKLSIEVIENLTKSVQTFAYASGQEASAAASTLARAFADPARGARELDGQFNFLTLSQRKYIDQLVEQGNTEQAALVLSQQLSNHLGTTMVENLGTLERAWDSVTGAVRRFKEGILDIGRTPTIEDQIAAVQAEVDDRRKRLAEYAARGRGTGRVDEQLAAAERRLSLLQFQKGMADTETALTAYQTRFRQRQKQARDEFDRNAASFRTAQEEFEQSKAKLDEALKLEAISQAEYDKRLRQYEKRRDQAESKGQRKAPRPRTERQLASDLYSIEQPLANITGTVDLEAVRRALQRQYQPAIDAASKTKGVDVEDTRRQVQLLVDVGTAQAEFNARLAEAQRLQADLAIQEEAVRTEQQQGLISGIEAETKLAGLRAAQVPALQEILTRLQEIRAALPAEAVATLDSMTAAIGQLQNQAQAATPVVVSLGTKLKNTFIDGVGDAAGRAVSDFENLRETAKNTLKGIAGDIVSSGIKELLADMFRGGGQGGGTGFFGGIIGGVRSIFGFAEGGHIRGPGTGTSDSIPAVVNGRMPIRVSNDEFIQPQRAVRHYGLGFMEAVRTLKLPKPRPGFAFGGLVQAHRQARFATGGATANATAPEAATPNVKIQLINNGTPQRVAQQSQQIMGKDMLVRLFLEDAQVGGPMIRGIQGALSRGG